jgi:hypothetical protein
MGAGSCIHYRRSCISTGGKVLRIVVAGVTITSLNSRRFLRRARSRHYVPALLHR